MLTQPQNVRTTSSQQPNKIQLINNSSASTNEVILKSQKLIKQAQNKIYNEIRNGQLKVRQTTKNLNLKSQQYMQNIVKRTASEKNVRQKIGSLNIDLKCLQRQMILAKQYQKQREDKKIRDAKFFIDKLKKQKQQYRNRMKFDEINSRLKFSAVSEDILKAMKEKRQQIVKQRKRDMELRIYQNINRQATREEQNVKNQIKYWSKIQQIQQRKNHNSVKILPTVHKSENNVHKNLGINNSLSHKNLVIPRKLSQINHKKSLSRHDTTNYQDVVKKFLEKAKAKQQSWSQNIPNRNRNSSKIVNISFGNANQQQNNSFLPTNKDDKEIVPLIYNENRRKILGDQYLKDSILRVKSPRKQTMQNESIIEQESMELKANHAFIHKNNKLQQQQQKWQKVLVNLLDHKVEKGQAIQMLSSIEKRLDKMDPGGIQKRLKMKLEAFEKYKNGQNKFVLQNIKIIQTTNKLELQVKDDNPQNSQKWQQSSEHGI